jgi:hypothetical protein
MNLCSSQVAIRLMHANAANDSCHAELLDESVMQLSAPINEPAAEN